MLPFAVGYLEYSYHLSPSVQRLIKHVYAQLFQNMFILLQSCSECNFAAKIDFFKLPIGYNFDFLRIQKSHNLPSIKEIGGKHGKVSLLLSTAFKDLRLNFTIKRLNWFAVKCCPICCKVMPHLL